MRFRSLPLTVFACGCLAVVALSSPTQKRNHIATSDDSFRLEFADRGTKFERLADGRQRVHVLDVSGHSRQQGVVFSGDKAVVVMRQTKDGEKSVQILDSGDLSGHAKVTVESNTASSQGSTTFASQSIILTEASSELRVKSPTEVTITHSGSDTQTKSRKLVATGASAVARLEPFASKVKQRLREAELTGGVTIDIDTVQLLRSEDGTTKNSVYKGRVTAAKATVKVQVKDGAVQWTYRLVGNVHLTGDQTEGGVTTNAELTLAAVTFVLNEKMELVSFEGGDET